MQILKPKTTYEFSENDRKMIFELTKIGHVHILSNQITLSAHEIHDGASIRFTDMDCPGFYLPANWVIEYIGFSNKRLHITFAVFKKTKTQ